MSPMKLGEKCSSRAQGDHGNLCGKIHNRTQALAFGVLLSPILKKHHLIASNSENPTLALNRAKIVARQVAQATETRSAAFGSHYAEAHVISNAVYKVTDRAHAFASQQSEKPQSDGPYPNRKNPVDFENFIRNRFEDDTGTKCQEPIGQAFPYSAPTPPAPKNAKHPLTLTPNPLARHTPRILMTEVPRNPGVISLHRPPAPSLPSRPANREPAQEMTGSPRRRDVGNKPGGIRRRRRGVEPKREKRRTRRGRGDRQTRRRRTRKRRLGNVGR